MRDVDYSSAPEFLENFFRGTEHAVDIRALSNDGSLRPVTRFTRDPQIVVDTCLKYDGYERGIYFGIATRLNGSHSGKREELAELPGVWVDIDCYKLGISKEDALAILLSWIMPPTVVIDSGGGLHAYWLFLEPMDVRYAPEVGRGDVVKDEIDSTCKQLAGVFAGDVYACDITRVLRLPGTHNSKTGELRPVAIVSATGNRYELSDLQEVLDTARPMIERLAEPAGEKKPAEPLDPYTEFARKYGFKAPIDVEARLAAMSYMADGDAGIHATQLSCSASLVVAGQATDDEIVEALLSATQAAAGNYALHWNWKREERAIQRMVETARAKFGSRPAKPPASAPPPPTTAAGPSQGGPVPVVNLAEERKARQKPAPPKSEGDEVPLIARIGEAVIGYWQDHHGLLISTGLGMATYSAETHIWTHFDDELELRLKVAIQGIFAGARVKPQINTLNAVRRYIIEHPKLHREAVAWDTSGLVIFCNVAVDPRDGSQHALGPELYATWRIDCDYDPEAACPQFAMFLARALEGLPAEEVAQIVLTLGEHMGASLVKGKHRNLRKGLYFLGKSRSGKTQLAHIYRALLGGTKRCTAIKMYALNDLFGAAPLIHAAAWIADDVMKEEGGRRPEPVNAEQLKNIITGEPMSIRVPGGRYVEVELDIPAVWTGNNQLLIRDDSEAVYNRMLIFPLNNEWPEDAPNPDPSGREIYQVILEHELAGIVNFALAGYARLKARGRYAPPPSMVAAVDELRAMNRPLLRWIEECTLEETETEIDNRDLMGSLRGWWAQEYGDDDHVPGGKAISAALRRYYPRMRLRRSHGQRLSMGVALSDDGIGCLQHAQATAKFGEAVGSGAEPLLVNRKRPKFC